jgi:hypothetical protein
MATNRKRGRFDDDPPDLVDADLAGDVVTITLPDLEARAVVRAARVGLALSPTMRTPQCEAGLTKLAVAVGDDRPDRLGPLRHEPVVDRFDRRTREGR